MNLEDHSTDLIPLQEKNVALSKKRGVLAEEIKRLRERMATNPSQGNAEEVMARALAGVENTAFELPDSEKLKHALADYDLCGRALELVYAEIQAAKQKASTAMCASVAPEHKKLAEKMVDAVIALRIASADYETFIEKLHDCGASTSSLPRLHRTWLDSPFDSTNSGFAHWLSEAVQAGHLTKKQFEKAFAQ